MFRREASERVSNQLFTLGELALVQEKLVSSSMVNAVKAIASNHIYGQNGKRVKIEPKVRAQAFVALGKLALRREALAKHFRPELVNRLDEVVLFHALGRRELKRIARRYVAGIEKLAADRSLTLELEDGSLQWTYLGERVFTFKHDRLPGDIGGDKFATGAAIRGGWRAILQETLIQKLF